MGEIYGIAMTPIALDLILIRTRDHAAISRSTRFFNRISVSTQ